MSNKPRSSQISVNTTSFSKNLSIIDNDIQKCFDKIDQLTIEAGVSSHNSLLGIQGGSIADGYYHFTGSQYNSFTCPESGYSLNPVPYIPLSLASTISFIRLCSSVSGHNLVHLYA